MVDGRWSMVGPGALSLRQPPSHPGGMAEHSRGSASIAAARPSRDADPRMQRTGIAPRRGARSRPHSAASCPFSNESVCTGSRRSLVAGRCAAVGRWVVIGVLARGYVGVQNCFSAYERMFRHVRPDNYHSFSDRNTDCGMAILRHAPEEFAGGAVVLGRLGDSSLFSRSADHHCCDDSPHCLHGGRSPAGHSRQAMATKTAGCPSGAFERTGRLSKNAD